MRSSNPVMSSLTENSSRQNSGYEDVSTRPMTVDDVVTKTGITLGVIIVAAAKRCLGEGYFIFIFVHIVVSDQE